MSTPAKISVSGQRPASGEFSPHYASSFFSPARSPFPAKASVSICPRGSPMLCLLLLFPAKRLFSMLFLFSFEKTPTLPRSFYSLSQHCHPTRNENPANQHLPQRGGGTSPARCFSTSA